MRIIVLLGRLIAGIAAALGLAAVARKFSEPPPEGTPGATPSITRGGTPTTTPGGAVAPGTTPATTPFTPPGQAGAESVASHQPRRLPGWSKPKPEVIPPPTYWPAVFGLGVAFLMWGFISNIFVFGFGVIFIVTAIAGWIGDLIHEFK